ncbi:GNAT family N-acetyltransferase [Tabrizicola piscis]|uniref:GNAT family N-acetyltransferase n=1 Tax=Tabrizicola piscis TaxID=2494374 RepID=A0A3S8U2R3_9RHOB|nr:GNAT family N-acetyltransferase [Tabrizicola piscis]AZL57891.1 GNAT family N-acetyltransferase [Tabrizicola piscis]
MLIRAATPADARQMADVLNAVIALGGTTAHEHPKTETQVRESYVTGPHVLSSVVAELDGRVVGWQSVEHWQGEAHIGTFVQPGLQAKGAGTRLFEATCATLRPKAVRWIIASIRADNVPGLAYYARIGFRDIAAEPDFALSDGRKVGRIHRRFDL